MNQLKILGKKHITETPEKNFPNSKNFKTRMIIAKFSVLPIGLHGSDIHNNTQKIHYWFAEKSFVLYIDKFVKPPFPNS